MPHGPACGAGGPLMTGRRTGRAAAPDARPRRGPCARSGPAPAPPRAGGGCCRRSARSRCRAARPGTAASRVGTRHRRWCCGDPPARRPEPLPRGQPALGPLQHRAQGDTRAGASTPPRRASFPATARVSHAFLLFAARANARSARPALTTRLSSSAPRDLRRPASVRTRQVRLAPMLTCGIAPNGPRTAVVTHPASGLPFCSTAAVLLDCCPTRECPRRAVELSLSGRGEITACPAGS